MKSFILSASVLAFFVGLSSCEKHDWDKTKKLYESHDAHGHADHGHDDHSENSHGEHTDKGHGEHASDAPTEQGHDHSEHSAH